MDASLRKLRALMGKDLSDMLKNPTMVVCMAMPVLFVLLYRFLMGNVAGNLGTGAPDGSQAALSGAMNFILLNTALCMAIGMTGSATLVYGLAEEKEKHTLRTLMLANVSAEQIMLSRGLVALAATAVVEALGFAVSGAPWHLFGPFMACGILGGLPIILLSLVLGLASRDQMTAGLYSVPILLVVIAPMLGGFTPQLAAVAQFLPTGGAVELLRLAVEGVPFGPEAATPLLVTGAWTAAGLVVFKLLYRKLASDN